MRIQKVIFTALTAVILPYSLIAQTTFDEIQYSKEKTQFHLNAPTSAEVDGVTGATPQVSSSSKPNVKVRLYNEGDGGKAYKTIKMKAIGENRWEATVTGDLQGKF